MNAPVDFGWSNSTGSLPVQSLGQGAGSGGIASIATVGTVVPQGPVVSLLLATIGGSERKPARRALISAVRWANELDQLFSCPNRVAVAASGSVHFYFIRDRKIASFECDSDGDVVLTLSDRSRDSEAEAHLVTQTTAQSAMARVLEFIWN
jgi:hypothetical protein